MLEHQGGPGRTARFARAAGRHPGWWANDAGWTDQAAEHADQEPDSPDSPDTGSWPRSRLPWIPVIIALIVQFPFLAFSIAVGVPLLHQGALALAFLSSFALLGVRRHPGPTVALVGLLTAPAIGLVIFGPPTPVLPLVFATVLAVVRGARAWAWGTVVLGAITAIVATLVSDSHPASTIRPLLIALVLCLFIGIGEAQRNRRERYRQFRLAQSQRRQSEAERERTRIARELHDVLAHSLSSINVQAGVGLHLIDTQPEKAAESLAAIKEASKQALDEVRGVLGVLRSGATAEAGSDAPRVPEPDLARLPSLAESVSAAGIAITVTNDLGADVPLLTQRAIYRIVQESLTNVTRHAHASSVQVTATIDDGYYLITIADNGSGSPAAAVGPDGRGILGMRERAQLLGGTLETGHSASGGYVVTARIPRRLDTGPAEQSAGWSTRAGDNDQSSRGPLDAGREQGAQ